MVLSASDYRDRVLACWLGKNIGGTLGAPFEWRRQVNQVEFYTQDLGGEPLPNDDLDIQLLWLIALEEKGLDLDAHILADWWLTYVTPHWAEYGNAKMNLRAGLAPPLSGSLNNAFKHSCGAFIRSEIWACIAPGLPEVAASYALQDAMLDHGDGEGTYAAVFCAVLESLAFVDPDILSLVEAALTFIPPECGVAKAVELALDLHFRQVELLEARDEMLAKFRGMAFMGHDWAISQEDKEKGFFDGELGWDAPSNIGLMVMALLYGEGDFSTSICTVVNCGEDTDCTAATVGALFGILNGTSGIPKHWIDPIGRGIKTACLNLGELGNYGDRVPKTVDILTDRTIKIAQGLLSRHNALQPNGDLVLKSQPFADPFLESGIEADLVLESEPFVPPNDFPHKVERALTGPTYTMGRFTVRVNYGPAGPTLGNESTVTVTVENSGPVQTHLYAQPLTGPDLEASVSPGTAPCPPERLGGPAVFIVSLRRVLGGSGPHRASLQLTVPGWPDPLLVPLTLMPGAVSSR